MMMMHAAHCSPQQKTDSSELIQWSGPGVGHYRPIIPSNGNPTGRLRYGPRLTLRSGQVAIFGMGRVRVSIIGYGYGSGS